MKLKAVLKEGCPRNMQDAVESPKFELAVIRHVLVPYLHMPDNVGPAEFYIQKSDESVGRKRNLCEVRLSGVSVNTKRATDDYIVARAALERLYAQTLHEFLPEGEQLQLMVSLMLDQPPFQGTSSLIERKGQSAAVWLAGGTPLPEDLARKV